MTSSTSTYLLPEPSSLIGSKSILIKQTSPTIMHPVHHQFQHPLHRPPPSFPVLTHSHQQMIKSMPTNDTFHSLTVANINNGNSLLTTNSSNTSTVLTTTTNNNTNSSNPNNNNSDELSNGLNGHSLSQSMESINNVGLQDDEVNNLFLFYTFG